MHSRLHRGHMQLIMIDNTSLIASSRVNARL